MLFIIYYNKLKLIYNFLNERIYYYQIYFVINLIIHMFKFFGII
jgi:hypothetical protein